MPIYTYRCHKGHEWDEVRTIEGSQTSEEPCRTCLEHADSIGCEIENYDLPDFAGRKVPSTGMTPVFRGSGWTPKFYPNRGK